MTDECRDLSDDDLDKEFELTDEQRAALEFNDNIAITAGAGTGKTTTLTERYLRILEETDVGPESIVTITFTNDAANEMLERIRAAVADRLADATGERYERWRTIKDDLENGYVHTIHGFCSRILREHVVDAPVTPEFEVYDETDAKALAGDVVRDIVDEKLADGDNDVELLARLWRRSTLEDVLVGLMGKRPESEVWLDRWRDADTDDYMEYIWTTVHPISPEFASEVFGDDDARQAFEEFRALRDEGIVDDVDPNDDDGSEKVREVSRLLDEYRPLAGDASARDQQQFLDTFCDLMTTNDGTRHGHDWWYWGSGSRWSGAGRDAEQARLEDAVETLFDVVDPETLDFGVARDETAAHYVLALASTFDEVLAAYERRKTRQNVVDYDDLIETTIAFLEDAPAVRERLRNQFEYVMVDEVQDTDPRQWTLVKLLTSGDSEDYDAQNVFLVGDEKQSIYRFRGADVTTFADARAELDEANPDSVATSRELSGNFRTTNETLAFANDLFQRLFEPMDGDAHKPYEARPQDLTAERETGQAVEGTCEYLFVPDDDYPELHGQRYLEETPRFIEPGEREAYAVAARLTGLFADPPCVYDDEAEKYREARPEDVAILLRSRTRLKAYERALDEYDIPYTVVSGTGFYDTPEVTALLNLLRVLADPTDERALFGVLRSPLFGIPDDDIARLRIADDELWTALADADGALGDAYQCIQQWRRFAGTHPDGDERGVTHWGTLLSRVIDDTGFLASIAGDERPRQATVNVNRLREQIRTWEEAGTKTATELVSRIEDRRELESHADEATIPEDTDGVEIRTVHSAKGLEFPIVAVPELGTDFNFQADVGDDGKVYLDEFDLSDSGTREPLLGIKSPSETEAFVAEDTLVRRVTRERMKGHDRAELKRLLYVAVTRARDHLLLSGVHELEDEDGAYALAEPSDADDANCWRDWTQPVIVDEEETIPALLDSGAWNAALPRSEYRVLRPERPVDDWREATGSDELSLTVDIPDIESRDRQAVVTASDYADIAADESGHGHKADREDDRDWNEVDDLHPGTLGTIVHRICERRPDRGRWEQFARDVAEREGETLAEDDFDRIVAYADRSLRFIEKYERDLEVVSAHDEFPVAARFDDVRVVGDIDRLVETPDAFHVIDYKTNDTTNQTVEELANYYWPQLRAYATALHQADPEKNVCLTLYFTDADEDRTLRLTPAGLEETADELHERLRNHASAS